MSYLYSSPTSAHQSTATLGFLGLDQRDYFSLAEDLRSVFRPASRSSKLSGSGTTSTRDSFESRFTRPSFDSRWSESPSNDAEGHSYMARNVKGGRRSNESTYRTSYSSTDVSRPFPMPLPVDGHVQPYSPTSTAFSPISDAFGTLPKKYAPMSPSVGVFNPNDYSQAPKRSFTAGAKKMMKRAFRMA